MRMEWHQFSAEERERFGVAQTFLASRLTDASEIEWALDLGPDRRAERLAITSLLHRLGGASLGEPWATVWGTIEKSWQGQSAALYGPSPGQIKRRIARGERTGGLISQIASLVAPRLEVSPTDSLLKAAATPAVPGDLVRPWPGAVRLVKPDDIGLPAIDEVPFLVALANALEGQMRYGMDAAKRIGWDGASFPNGRLGRLRRVEWAPGEMRGEDVDQLACGGITPSVKLLYAVVSRIAELDVPSARDFVKTWSVSRTPLDVRLWAAAALDPSVVTSGEVEGFLTGLDNYAFWELHDYPEVALLRARRFGDMDRDVREQVARRLVGLPPSSLWPSGTAEEDLEEPRLYCALLELMRIEVCGGELPSGASAWLADNRGRFGNLEGMSHDSGVPGGSRRVATTPPVPEARYDEIDGVARLRALEDAWGNRSNWRADGPARDWISQPGNAFAVFRDLQAAGDVSYEHPFVWAGFCDAHRPSRDDDTDRPEAKAVLESIEALPSQFLQQHGRLPTNWMREWGRCSRP